MVHVDKAHSASTKKKKKKKPSQLDFAILMSLKHGNSLLLNQETKNG